MPVVHLHRLCPNHRTDLHRQHLAGSPSTGDDGWAAEAVLRFPSEMAFDPAGNLYIADRGTASVRKVTPYGLITTFAGTGVVGYSGDGGPASRTQLSSAIGGLAIDPSGNVYIVDGGNNRIRKVSVSDGRISTFVDGAKLPKPEAAFGFGEIAIDSAGNLYIAVSDKHQVFRIAPDGTFAVFAGTGTPADTGDGGPATQAAFVSPAVIYVDASGTVYVGDQSTNRFRKITPDGVISAFAGSGKRGFGGDGGPATQASLNVPRSLAPDASGNLYFVDYNNYRVRRIAPDGTIATVAGNGNSTPGGVGGPATKAQFNAFNVTVSANGNLYISDYDSAIRVVTASDGIIRRAYGKRHSASDGVLATDAMFDIPVAFAADGQGNFYVGDGFRVRKIDATGVLSTIAGNDVVFASNTGDGGAGTSASIYRSAAVTTDTEGNVYIGSANKVRRVSPDGIIITIAGADLSGFSGDGGTATAASLSSPVGGLAVDASGSLYIADSGNHRIRRMTPDGVI